MKGANMGLIRGLGFDFRDGGVISLQYADDTILFSDIDLDHLLNLKGILMWFEQLSGMRVNFHKSEIIAMNVSEETAHDISHIFACPLGNFPIKYLGISTTL